MLLRCQECQGRNDELLQEGPGLKTAAQVKTKSFLERLIVLVPVLFSYTCFITEILPVSWLLLIVYFGVARWLKNRKDTTGEWHGQDAEVAVLPVPTHMSIRRLL